MCPGRTFLLFTAACCSDDQAKQRYAKDGPHHRAETAEQPRLPNQLDTTIHTPKEFSFILYRDFEAITREKASFDRYRKIEFALP